MQTSIPELLAPAGSMESAIAAINAGADALYLGGKNFSARSSAQNFTEPELVGLIDYAAVRRVKIYIAVNTLYKNDEMPRVLDFVGQMYNEGAVAFILQDPGLAYILKTRFPQVEIHASTQMTIHSTAGAKFMKGMGFSRVVLSRELSLAEVGEISNLAGIECEVFVHGALCISYSGQCLMSSLIGGRSGNRGKCAQICRTRYDLTKDGTSVKNGYLLSPKDMMTLEILGGIAAAGVTSLKIEGRMKSPEYVYLVTKAYREKLDNMDKAVSEAVLSLPGGSGSGIWGRAPFEETLQNVLQIFNRGGSFSTGYYNTRAGLDMMSIVTPKNTGVLVGKVVSYKNSKCEINFTHDMRPGDGIEVWTADGKHVGTGVSKQISAGSRCVFALDGAIEKGNDVYRSYEKRLVDNTKKAIATDEKKISVDGSIEAVAGARIKLTLYANDEIVEKFGDIVETARNAPMLKDEILEQLSKTGGTPFAINFTQIKIDENIFVSKAALNQLRRGALEALEAAIVKARKRDCGAFVLPEVSGKSEAISGSLSVQISSVNHLPTVLGHNVSRVYLGYTTDDINALPAMLKSKRDTEVFIALPYISRNAAEKDMQATFADLEALDIDGYLVSTYGQLQILRSMDTKKQIMLNYTFNIFNNRACEFFANMGITLSQELNIHEINEMNAREFELVVYGRQILMSTHNCPAGIYGSACKNSGTNSYALRDRMGMDFPIQTDCHNCIAYVLNSKILDTSSKFQAIKNTGAKSFRLIFTDESEETINATICRYKDALAGASVKKQPGGSTYGHFFRGVE